MSDGFQFFDIILFAMVAAFLVLRLRSVLGRRTGTEQRRDLFPPRPPEAAPTDNVVSLVDRNKAGAGSGPAPADGGPLPLAAQLDSVRSADPSFEETGFLRGARGAFEIIVTAFAAGNTATLRPLLSDDVYERFAEAIRARTAAGETQETKLAAIDAADIVEARTSGGIVLVTVRLASDQTNVTRGRDGAVVDGDPDKTVERTDFWTFARDPRSSDPNWQLVATRSG
ncbi:MAG TPA: Tim44/TimA family putative adaptor protein [Stellaceae bacterium]|jgi:predicted lipid-binding transport protein (Tim44 family)